MSTSGVMSFCVVCGDRLFAGTAHVCGGSPTFCGECGQEFFSGHVCSSPGAQFPPVSFPCCAHCGLLENWHPHTGCAQFFPPATNSLVTP